MTSMTRNEHLVAARLLSDLEKARRFGVEVESAVVHIGGTTYDVRWSEDERQYRTSPTATPTPASDEGARA